MSELSTTSTAPSNSSTDDASIEDKATDSMQAATRAGSDVAQTATDRAKDVAQETTRQARDLLGEAREQMHNQAGQQQQNLVSNLRSVGDELGTMAGASNQGDIAHDLAGRAGDHAHELAEWLDVRQPGELLDELRAFARRRPGTFLLGAAMAGVLAGRLTRGVVATHTDDQPAQDAHSGPATHGPPSGGPGSQVAVTSDRADVGAPEVDVNYRATPGGAPAAPYSDSQPDQHLRTSPGLGEASQ